MLGRLRYSVLVLSALEERWRVRDVATASLTVGHRSCVQKIGDPETGGFGGDCNHQTTPLRARSHVGCSPSLVQIGHGALSNYSIHHNDSTSCALILQ